jgi:hypothetical protein
LALAPLRPSSLAVTIGVSFSEFLSARLRESGDAFRHDQPDPADSLWPIARGPVTSEPLGRVVAQVGFGCRRKGVLSARGVLDVPENARLSYLVELPESEDLGANIDDPFECG